MVYAIFILFALGIVTYKIAKKVQRGEYLIRRKLQMKKRWELKQKGNLYGKAIHRNNKPPSRKR